MRKSAMAQLKEEQQEAAQTYRETHSEDENSSY
jgi:hypothetical protein